MLGRLVTTALNRQIAVCTQGEQESQKFWLCEWRGDITRPDVEILAECRKALEVGHDVDKPNQTDEQLLNLIIIARQKWAGAPARKAAAEKAEAEDIKHKIDSGFCFYCETWCHGDCGHYTSDPTVKFERDLKTAQAESNYGINEE